MINNNVNEGFFLGSEEMVKRKVEMDKYCLYYGYVIWFEFLLCKIDDYKWVIVKVVDRIL